jgi:hypothetical protein
MTLVGGFGILRAREPLIRMLRLAGGRWGCSLVGCTSRHGSGRQSKIRLGKVHVTNHVLLPQDIYK